MKKNIKNAVAKAAKNAKNANASETPATQLEAPPAVITVPASKGGAHETLAATTLDAGDTTVGIRRHDLKDESKCMRIKRLLCQTPALHINDIAADELVQAKHTGTAKALLSTIRTLRADMIRAGANVTATVTKQMTRAYKAPTVAVLKLRLNEIGASKHTTEVKRFSVAPATPAPAAEATSEAPSA